MIRFIFYSFFQINSNNEPTNFLFSLKIYDNTAITDIIVTNEDAVMLLGCNLAEYSESIDLQMKIIEKLNDLSINNVSIEFYIKSYYVFKNNQTNNNENKENKTKKSKKNNTNDEHSLNNQK